MKRLLVAMLILGVGVTLGRVFDGVVSPVQAQQCAAANGDVNADGFLGLPDAIVLLGHLFQGTPSQLQPLCATGAALPDTGQSTCYDSLGLSVDCALTPCGGQDGAYSTGCGSLDRFFDNGDGTVTDTCTGLMWLQETGNNGTAVSWCTALDYCEALDFAGHDDWRLPNVRELQSIVDYQTYSPAIDAVFESQAFLYWSSTTVADSTDLAWNVGFFDGGVYVAEKGIPRNVRAVRSLP